MLLVRCGTPMARSIISCLRELISIKNDRRLYSSRNSRCALQQTNTESITGPLNAVDVGEFRRRAFTPGIPILIISPPLALHSTDTKQHSIPAIHKWFPKGTLGAEKYDLYYLKSFQHTLLPYELIIESTSTLEPSLEIRTPCFTGRSIHQSLVSLLKQFPTQGFHRFNAPLAIFLHASILKSHYLKLYIAQAQIADLPKELQDDLPTPTIVKEAGKGDVYDSNIWMGKETYTPLHKDPNPNLFVQLEGEKDVRLFPPDVGRALFLDVQQKIGQQSSATFRGEEMMEGPERLALEEAVWGQNVPDSVLHATVCPGDALFIPKGWWHSVKSVSQGVTASANWWFR